MHIAYLAAGAAGMYCGSCLHDNTLAAALIKSGEDVTLAPIYTPIRTDEDDVSEPRVFFGGINAYLQQRFPLFRRTPKWIDGWLDHPALLRMFAGRGLSVEPAKLGDMTVSMLRGENGNQRKELYRLTDWLSSEVRPDVVHLSNAMMLGLAREIKSRMRCPVVCTLSGEDIFLEKLREPHYGQARSILRERAAEVDAFVALNKYYADFMVEYLAISPAKTHVIPHGLELTGHSAEKESSTGRPARVGYLARICPDKGLHLLVEACEQLAHRDNVPTFELHIAGFLAAADRRYMRQIELQLCAGPLRDRHRWHGELDRKGKITLLRSLDVLATPTVYRESKGLPVLEAWANGTPVVMPAHGTYPELIERSRAGLLHNPMDSRDLAEKLFEIMRSPDIAAAMGRRGRQEIESHFTAARMAEQTVALYRQLLPYGELPI